MKKETQTDTDQQGPVKVEILTNTAAYFDGRCRDVKKGEVLEIEAPVAKRLIELGHARAADGANTQAPKDPNTQ